MTLNADDGMKLAYGVKDRVKYVVVVGISTDYALVGSLLVNSKINTIFKNTEGLQNSQVPLKKDDYSFLKHDSYLDCSSILRPNIVKVLANAQEISELTAEDKSIVKQLLSDSEHIALWEKKKYDIIK